MLEIESLSSDERDETQEWLESARKDKSSKANTSDTLYDEDDINEETSSFGGLSGGFAKIETTQAADVASQLTDEAIRKSQAEMIYGSDEELLAPFGGEDWNFDKPETYTITKLTPGVKDPNRVNVFLDGHFVLSLDINQVIEFGLKTQQEITPERLKELKWASEFGKLYQRSLEWVLTRPHSVREARDYLRRRQIKRRQLNRQRVREEKKPLAEFDDELLDAVLKRLIEKKYLNDRKFAEFYVENRYVRKGISHKRLRMELMRKGIESDMITSVFEAVPRDEDEEIMKMIAKKRKKYNDFQLVGYLVRQGFNFYNAKTAVERYGDGENKNE